MNNPTIEQLIKEKIKECEENIVHLVQKAAQEEKYLKNLQKLLEPETLLKRAK